MSTRNPSRFSQGFSAGFIGTILSSCRFACVLKKKFRGSASLAGNSEVLAEIRANAGSERRVTTALRTCSDAVILQWSTQEPSVKSSDRTGARLDAMPRSEVEAVENLVLRLRLRSRHVSSRILNKTIWRHPALNDLPFEDVWVAGRDYRLYIDCETGLL